MQIKGIMKVHHFARGIWEHEPTSLTLGCKRLRPLAPKLISSTTTAAARTTVGTYDLKSFIRSPESSTPRKVESSDHQHKKESAQVEAAAQAAGGTRWNPTQEQITILEMMYRGGMRTPNAQQIEQITVQLGKFGKIEGKNVFYWFQNHKARERQKQKRNSTTTTFNSTTPDSPSSPFSTTLLSPPPVGGMEEEIYDCAPYKRKCRSWGFDQCVEGDSRYSEEQVEEDRTLKLFPLHPEGIKFLN